MKRSKYLARVEYYRTRVQTRRKHGIRDVVYSVPTNHGAMVCNVASDDPFNDELRSCRSRKPFDPRVFNDNDFSSRVSAAKARL